MNVSKTVHQIHSRLSTLFIPMQRWQTGETHLKNVLRLYRARTRVAAKAEAGTLEQKAGRLRRAMG